MIHDKLSVIIGLAIFLYPYSVQAQDKSETVNSSDLNKVKCQNKTTLHYKKQATQLSVESEPLMGNSQAQQKDTKNSAEPSPEIKTHRSTIIKRRSSSELTEARKSLLQNEYSIYGKKDANSFVSGKSNALVGVDSPVELQHPSSIGLPK